MRLVPAHMIATAPAQIGNRCSPRERKIPIPAASITGPAATQITPVARDTQPPLGNSRLQVQNGGYHGPTTWNLWVR